MRQEQQEGTQSTKTLTNTAKGAAKMETTTAIVTPNTTTTLTLVSNDPRFLPVTFNGRTYITSTLLHKQKREGGMSKYELLADFTKMIRNIDCFDRLAESTDIIELDGNLAKSFSSVELAELVKSNSYRKLMLISPAAATHTALSSPRFRKPQFK